jgi:hypothetical protein
MSKGAVMILVVGAVLAIALAVAAYMAARRYALEGLRFVAWMAYLLQVLVQVPAAFYAGCRVLCFRAKLCTSACDHCGLIVPCRDSLTNLGHQCWSRSYQQGLVQCSPSVSTGRLRTSHACLLDRQSAAGQRTHVLLAVTALLLAMCCCACQCSRERWLCVFRWRALGYASVWC